MTHIILVVMMGFNPNNSVEKPPMEIHEYLQKDMAACQKQAALLNRTITASYRVSTFCVEKTGE